MKLKAILLLLFVLILSCNDDEENIITSTKITEFKISSTENVTTYTEINNTGDKIIDHGVVWYKNKDFTYKISLGNLSTEKFENIISSNLMKDSIYNVFSFLELENKLISSDTLEFISPITSKIKIDDFYPKNGFIGDTVSIKGKNFCVDDFYNSVSIVNNGSRPNIVSETDSIIQFTIPSNLNSSKFSFNLSSCNMTETLSGVFSIDEPVIDSIETTNKYVGDELIIYGKNIHYSISDVWLDNIETTKVGDYQSTDKLTIKIPRGLSAGKVDLKLQVLDKEIIKEKYFQTTTPVLEKIIPNQIGFLDTIKIVGKYFTQKNAEVKVKVSNRDLKVINVYDDSLKVVVDRYFSDNEPKLVTEISSFLDTIDLNMLPPKILGFDKEKYHLTDNVTIKTDAFIESNNLYVADEKQGFRDSFDIDPSGKATISLNEWLDASVYYASYNMVDGGKLSIDIENTYGKDSNEIQIYAPVIESINKNSFVYGEYMKLTGVDFAYDDHNNIYIDGDLVENPHNSSYSVTNTAISFQLIDNTTDGQHELYVEVAGQKSNTITFNVEGYKINENPLDKISGTRRDIYTLSGENISEFKINANDSRCDIIAKTEDEISFYLPYGKALTNVTKITALLGDQNIEISDFQGIESHEETSNSLEDVSYYKRHVSGSNENDWYYINNNGVFKFDTENKKWQLFDDGEVPFNTPVFGEKQHLTVTDNKLYLPLYQTLYIYDLNTKKWENISLSISIKNGVYKNNMLYGVNNNDSEFYEYNLNTHTYDKIAKSSSYKFYYENITFGDDKIFFSPIQGEAFYYDIDNKSFTSIGKPRSFYGTYQNVSLKYYKNKLYFSGGLTDAGEEHRIYEYDLSLKTWTEKTPLLAKMYNHHTFIKDGVFYFGLGLSQYGYLNRYLNIYDLSKDPH